MWRRLWRVQVVYAPYAGAPYARRRAPRRLWAGVVSFVSRATFCREYVVAQRDIDYVAQR